MIHWTRQIKEVVASQDQQETADSSGPLEEIEFWRARCEDLSGLTRQLEQPGVLRVTAIIERAKSSYLTPFLKLSRLIQVGVGVGWVVGGQVLLRSISIVGEKGGDIGIVVKCIVL